MIKKSAKTLKIILAAAIPVIVSVLLLSACGGDDFFDTTSDRLKSAKSGGDPEQVFLIVADVFTHAIETGSNTVDVSSLSTDKIGMRIQRSIFTGFDKSGILPHVDVKLAVNEFDMSDSSADAAMSVKFTLNGEQYEKTAAVALEKKDKLWAVTGFEYTE